jgi:hypothetical protein
VAVCYGMEEGKNVKRSPRWRRLDARASGNCPCRRCGAWRRFLWFVDGGGPYCATCAVDAVVGYGVGVRGARVGQRGGVG